jgi:hypothetical protein
VAYPEFVELSIRYPWLKNVKYQFMELGQNVLDYWQNSKNQFDWIYDVNIIMSPTHVAKNHQLGLQMKSWNRAIDSGKKVAIVWGHDKPRVFIEDGKYVFKFLDIFGSIGRASMAGENAWSDEFFYWTPAFPKICIKQGHVLKNYLQIGEIEQLVEHATAFGYKQVGEKKYYLDTNRLHQLIYADWNTKHFTVGKPPGISQIITPRDYWILELDHADPMKKYWQNGINHCDSIVPEYWRNGSGHLIDAGIKGNWSKSYFLEK